jgi:hypothetical protein
MSHNTLGDDRDRGDPTAIEVVRIEGSATLTRITSSTTISIPTHIT